MSAANLNTTAKANSKPSPRFPLGSVFMTPGAIDALEEAGQMPVEFLGRHQSGDWGELSAEDRKENEFSVTNGFRILSAYRTKASVKIWLITECDRSATTILLPSEY
jgi:hypothetical protein